MTHMDFCVSCDVIEIYSRVLKVRVVYPTMASRGVLTCGKRI
jgi:hypothetical protein